MTENATENIEEKVKDLEEHIKNMIIDHPICHWTTYSGSHCRRTIVPGKKDDEKIHFCSLHKQLILDYKYTKKSDELCDTYETIKVTPRSYKHIRSVMNNMGNEDDLVNVYMVGGLVEEADLSDHKCVTILSDDYKYYYKPTRGQPKAKNIKIILKRYCQDNSIITIDGTKYCEECYKKIKGVPKISVLM